MVARPEASRRLFGHSLHQVLIVFPFGLLLTAVIFDLLAFSLGASELLTVSYWTILAGLVGGVLAAPFGLLDWFNIPSATRAKKIGLLHAAGNVIILLLFAVSWWLRRQGIEPSGSALALSFMGAGVLVVTGWLGRELVARLGVGVDRDAHVDASSSFLRHAPVEGGTGMKLAP